ncbi:hypothetical protein AYK26_07505 [Euryarchaeota archaeon SM23-78]|nr:MAG: hypothetical protein AYK26_07505 [Euryarchaeota archaeon SM23-78]
MAKRKKKVLKPVPQPKPSEPEDLRVYVAEAEQVDLMTRTEGWNIIQRDIEDYRDKIGSRLAYLNPKTLEYEEARINYLAADKLLKMIEDYAENKKRAIELLEKIDNPQENIVLDVDNA